jgi:hypothetical protein
MYQVATDVVQMVAVAFLSEQQEANKHMARSGPNGLGGLAS